MNGIYQLLIYADYDNLLGENTCYINRRYFFFWGGGLFAVPCIFKYSNKTPNEMQQSVVKLQFDRAPDDGHNNARNILSSVYATKQ
jgi:hypothetical protein